MMLISGDPAQCGAVMPELETMTGLVVNLGPKPGVAAAYKLFGNLTVIGMMGVVADVVRLAHAVGVAPADAVAKVAARKGLAFGSKESMYVHARGALKPRGRPSP